MKTFISWSGPLSKEVATLLSSWIPDVLQGTKTWLSMDDIDKGSIWFGDINEELSETDIGILCLTRENIDASWILFEAGALSKGLSKNRVCPLLVNLNHTDLNPPLSQFTCTLPNEADMLNLVKTINKHNGDNALDDGRMEKAFNVWWESFDTKFSAILKQYKQTKEFHKKSVEEMVEEILQISRSLQRNKQESRPYIPAIWDEIKDLDSELMRRRVDLMANKLVSQSGLYKQYANDYGRYFKEESSKDNDDKE